MTIRSHVLVATSSVMISATAATAIPIGLNEVVFPSGVDSTDAVHGGVQLVLNDNLIQFRLDPTPETPLTDMGGQVQNRVTEISPTTLRFAPRLRDTFNIEGGTYGIIGFQLTGFGDFDLDVDYRTDGLGDKGITSVSRSVSGDILTFRYDDPLLVDAVNPPGRQEESFFPSIVAEASDYALTGSMTIFAQLFEAPIGVPPDAIGDAFTVTIEGIAVPVPPAIPLPASGVLLLAGLAGLRMMRRAKS